MVKTLDREDEIDKAYNFDPKRTANSLSKSEQTGDSFSYDNSSENKNGNARDSIEYAEQYPKSNWTTKVNTGSSQSALNKFGKVYKKNGPIGLISVLLLGGGGLLGIIGTPSLLLIHIKEVITEKWNSQATSFEVRSNKILTNKLKDTATTGVCSGAISVHCRYSRVSNRMLKQFEKAGIEALDANGNTIKQTSTFGEKPSQLRYIDADGKPQILKANNFSKEIRSNAYLRAAFHKAYAPRWVAFSDKVFSSVMSKFKLTKANRLAGATKQEDALDKLNSAVASDGAKTTLNDVDEDGKSKPTTDSVDDPAETAKKAAKGSGTASKTITKEAAEGFIKNGIDGTKGGIVAMAVGGLCMVQGGSSGISTALRLIQVAQLINYAMVFFTAADNLKAGSNESLPAETLGNKLTAVTKDSSGNITKKAATDGFGMGLALRGDTINSSTSSWTNYVPGGGWSKSLSSLSKITGGDVPAIKKACKTVNGTAGQIVMGIAGGWTGIITAAAGFLLADGVTSLLSPFIEKMMNSMAGTLVSSDTSGEDAGDAIASGAFHLFSETAAAGGNGMLSVDQTMAYNQVTKDIQLAYAEEDRLNLSPFDISSKNTFMGSIYSSLVTYTSNISSVGDFFGSLLSINKSILANISGSSTYAAENSLAKSWSMCDDENISGKGVAAGPFCNVSYGVPTQYLDKDPEDVLAALAGQFDETTGEPTSGGLKEWVEKCSSGTGEEGIEIDACKIDSEEKANYALYMIDKRVLSTMDEDQATTNPSTQSDSGSAITGDVKSLAQQILDNPNITLSGGSWNSGSTTPKSQIEATASGQSAIPSVVTTSYSRDLDPRILKVILTVAQKHKITVTSLIRTQMTAGGYSKHPYGKAVDLSPIGSCNTGASSECIQAINEIMDANILPAGGGFGQTSCSTERSALAAAINAKGLTSFDDTCNHLHIDLGDG